MMYNINIFGFRLKGRCSKDLIVWESKEHCTTM